MTIIVVMHWIYRNRRSRVSNESEVGTEGRAGEFGMSGSDAVAKEEMRSRRRFIETAFFAATSSFVISRSNYAMASESRGDRFSRGLEILRQIGGGKFYGAGNLLSENAPRLSRFTVQYTYRPVLFRPG